jgi:hypothetical protein
MDNSIGRDFLGTGMRVVVRQENIEVFMNDGSKPSDKNATPILSRINLGVTLNRPALKKTFAPFPKPIIPVEEESNGTTFLPVYKKLS